MGQAAHEYTWGPRVSALWCLLVRPFVCLLNLERTRMRIKINAQAPFLACALFLAAAFSFPPFFFQSSGSASDSVGFRSPRHGGVPAAASSVLCRSLEEAALVGLTLQRKDSEEAGAAFERGRCLGGRLCPRRAGIPRLLCSRLACAVLRRLWDRRRGQQVCGRSESWCYCGLFLPSFGAQVQLVRLRVRGTSGGVPAAAGRVKQRCPVRDGRGHEGTSMEQAQEAADLAPSASALTPQGANGTPARETPAARRRS